MGLKNLLISAVIIGLLCVAVYRVWLGPQTADERPPSDRFMRTCQETAARRPRPQDYCQCLWKKGVRNLSALFTSKKAQAIARSCEATGEDK